MKPFTKICLISLLSLFAGLNVFHVQTAEALEKPGTELEKVGIVTLLGTKVDLTLPFTDSDGKTAALADFIIPDRPVIIVPAYYHCPRLCGLVFDGVTTLLQEIGLTLGTDYQVLTVSFDPEETPDMAEGRRSQYIARFENQLAARKGWNFLVGPQSSITPLMQQLGFRYEPDLGEFAHSSAIMLLTPQGEISQYFTGIEYPAWDVKLALVEASENKIGSAIDHVMLFCFRFDPTKGRYTWVAFGVMRAGGVITLVLLSFLLYSLWKKERSRAAL